MSKTTAIDRNVVRTINEELLAAAREIAAKYGLQADPKGATFNSSSMTSKIEFAVVGEDGVAASKDVQAFKLFAPSYRLEADDFGKTFDFRGTAFTICGARPDSPKYPILAKNAAGKVYKFQPDHVRTALGRH